MWATQCHKQLPVPPINMVVLGTRPSPAAQHRVFDAHRPAFLNMLMGDSLTDKDSSYLLSMCMYICSIHPVIYIYIERDQLYRYNIVVYVYVFVYIYICFYMYGYIYIWLCIYIYGYIYIVIYIWLYIYIVIYIYGYIYMVIYIWLYIYTW